MGITLIKYSFTLQFANRNRKATLLPAGPPRVYDSAYSTSPYRSACFIAPHTSACYTAPHTSTCSNLLPHACVLSLPPTRLEAPTYSHKSACSTARVCDSACSSAPYRSACSTAPYRYMVIMIRAHKYYVHPCMDKSYYYIHYDSCKVANCWTNWE